jgi:hypothetical protein
MSIRRKEDPQMSATETKRVQSRGENASRFTPSEVERIFRGSGGVDIRCMNPFRKGIVAGRRW